MAVPTVGTPIARAQFSSSVFTNTLNNPTGLAAGDLLVAHVSQQNHTPTSVTNNNGLTLWGTPNTARGTQIWQAVYTKIAAGTEGASTTFTVNGVAEQICQVVMFWVRGVNQTTPRDGNPGHGGAAANPVAPPVTVTNNDSLLLVVSCVDDPASAATPAGMTEHYDREAPDSEAPAMGFTSAGYWEARNSGATGTRTVSWNTGENALASSMVIAPAPPSGGAMVGMVHI
jgi:hypothetical protein